MDLIYSNLLKIQAKHHDVTLVTLERSGAERDFLCDAKALCKSVHIVESPNRASLASRVSYRAYYETKALLLWRPTCTLYDSPPDLRRLLRDLTTDQEYDVVEIHHSPCAGLVQEIKSKQTILYMYDVHFRARDRATATKTGLSRLVATAQAARFRSYESQWVPRFSAVLVGQDADRVVVDRFARPDELVDLMPNVIDTESVRPSPFMPESDGIAIFVGAMTHRANVDAVIAFSKDQWPKIKRRVPLAKWWIVGHKPPGEVRALDGVLGISVFGSVPDVREYIAKAAVYVAPLRIGSGVKVKIIEALSMGKAIVATSVAAEGMELENGRDALIADESEGFVDAVVELFANAVKRRELESNAREVAVARYSFEAGSAKLDDFYRRMGIEAGGNGPIGDERSSCE